jgi:bacterioferritin
MLQCDLKLELIAIPDLRDAIEYCESVRDYVSRDLFQKILDNEEEHVDWIETQIGLIDKVGLENYLQSKMNA